LIHYSPIIGALGDIDITTCETYGGTDKVAAPAHSCARSISASMHVTANIEDTAAPRRRFQANTCTSGEKAKLNEFNPLPGSRVPPQVIFSGSRRD